MKISLECVLSMPAVLSSAGAAGGGLIFFENFLMGQPTTTKSIFQQAKSIFLGGHLRQDSVLSWMQCAGKNWSC